MEVEIKFECILKLEDQEEMEFLERALRFYYDKGPGHDKTLSIEMIRAFNPGWEG